MLRIFLFRCLAGFPNDVPARIDLQVRGNNMAELARDCGRKRRLDIVVAVVSLAITGLRSRHGCFYNLWFW